ncbi:MAG: ribbon-helix-helix domain-containing protein [Patescibacteria group bacterium]
MAKVMISIPDKLLKDVDEAAKRDFETRSGFIRELVVDKLAKTNQSKSRGNLDRLSKFLDQASTNKWNFTDGVEYVRSIRGNWEKGIPKD